MYLLMLPYIALACAYCVDAWNEPRYSKLLKPLLMPVLIIGYCAMARPIRPLMVVGMLLGWVGDVALMHESDKAFIAGLGGFLLGHLMYGIWFIMNLGGAFSPWTLAYVPFAVCAGVLLFRHLRSGLGQMKIPALMYDVTIFLMSTCAFALLLARPSGGSLLIWLGSLFFIVSDSVLAQGIFLKPTRRQHFNVMSTYTCAQFLIALGAALMA